MLKRTLLVLTAEGSALGGAAQATELASVSRLAFGPDGTLFVAD